MKNKRVIYLMVVLVLLMTAGGLAGCATTFKGRVIDADTKEPIEGAVVVAKWNEAWATVAGSLTKVKDVKEALTDENGEWKIRGPRGRENSILTAIFSFVTGTSYIRPPGFIVFKPGYCSLPAGYMIYSCYERMILPKGNKRFSRNGTIGLPKFPGDRNDRLQNQAIGPIYGGDNILSKQREFIRLLNIERRTLGLGELEMPEEIENEK